MNIENIKVEFNYKKQPQIVTQPPLGKAIA